MFALLRLAALVSALAFSAAQANATDPARVSVGFSSAYIPQGFDSNDRIQLVGEGTFRNSCYRPAPMQTRVDDATRTITVTPTAYEYSGFCLQVILPFDREIDIGVLKAGTWQVKQEDGADLGKIEVAPATRAEPDDYHYAPISQAFVRSRGMKANILLAGNFPNSCMRLQETKVDVQTNVVVVKPIVVMDARPDCKDGSFPFHSTSTANMTRPGRYLLHVRSMNGKAVNTLFDMTR